MNIYIDESGSFARSQQSNSWNVVVTLTAAEHSRSAIEHSLSNLKSRLGLSRNTEVKAGQMSDADYLCFLHDLNHRGVLLFVVATDSGINTDEVVKKHKSTFVELQRDQIARMRYAEGRNSQKQLVDQLEKLPLQQYEQIVCQVAAIQDTIFHSINYYAQVAPPTLGSFRWRIDQKNSAKPTFEEAFEKIAPMLLQAFSINDPFPWVHGFNYSYMKIYELTKETAPRYLQEEYGLPEMDGFNLQKVLRDNMEFVDSKSSSGMQAVDVVARGMRRLLRGQFDNIDELAASFGKLTVQHRRGRMSINLAGFTEETLQVPAPVANVVRRMDATARAFLQGRQRLMNRQGDSWGD